MRWAAVCSVLVLFGVTVLADGTKGLFDRSLPIGRGSQLGCCVLRVLAKDSTVVSSAKQPLFILRDRSS